MLVSQVYFFEEQHAFHLYLHVPYKGHNTLVSNIPYELLEKNFPSTFATLKYGYFADAFSADEYLTKMSEKIIATHSLHQFFYPEYLLGGCGRVSFGTAEAIIKLIDNLPIYSRTHYCEGNCPLLFWVLSIKYNRLKRHILRTGLRIPQDVFEDYLFNQLMTSDYRKIQEPGDVYLTLLEYGNVEYVLVIGIKKELKFFISL